MKFVIALMLVTYALGQDVQRTEYRQSYQSSGDGAGYGAGGAAGGGGATFRVSSGGGGGGGALGAGSSQTITETRQTFTSGGSGGAQVLGGGAQLLGGGLSGGGGRQVVSISSSGGSRGGGVSSIGLIGGGIGQQISGGLGGGAVTGVPEYFTTTRYGPISSGGLRGEGDRSSSLTYTRQGSASGSLFSRDQAEASETASKTRGYEYRYREGHNYEQPKTLYNYEIEEPIWGFADVDFIYRGEQ